MSAPLPRINRSELKNTGVVELLLALLQSEKTMNIFYIIGVVVVIVVVAGFFGLHV